MSKSRKFVNNRKNNYEQEEGQEHDIRDKRHKNRDERYGAREYLKEITWKLNHEKDNVVRDD